MPTDHTVWTDFYGQFPYCSAATVREGCEPRVMLQPKPADHAVVLVHGLTDSPYFMGAIGKYFFDELHYDVYMPLLHCHGLKKPNGMKGVSLKEWKDNVLYAVETARQHSRNARISIGGLSTGGTLSFWAAAQKGSPIDGALYLFSAALGLAGKWGDLFESVGRYSFVAELLDRDGELIGANPFRYEYIDKGGAHELVKLIDETKTLIAAFADIPFETPVFAAHSRVDTTADIKAIRELQAVTTLFTSYVIPAAKGVSHASLVLAEPVHGAGTTDVLEHANPSFHDMMAEAVRFARRYDSGTAPTA